MSPRVCLEDHPPLACWFCGSRHAATALVSAGILISRAPRDGGPYRLVSCPSCLTENMLECTSRGRWFSSPSVRVSFLDYLFSPSESGDRQSQLILQAIAWLRENEARRRRWFERDGDTRYSSRNILGRILPWLAAADRAAIDDDPTEDDTPGDNADEAAARRARAERERRRERERRSREERAREEPRSETSQEPPPKRHGGLLSPSEILGVPRDASPAEIKRRFHYLAIRYHPDKVHHLGPDFREQAHLKFIELERAYRVLMERAGEAREDAEGA